MLTPTRPIEGGGRCFRSLVCQAEDEGEVSLWLELAPSGEEQGLALMREVSERPAGEILRLWLRREVPDLRDWTLQRLHAAPKSACPRPQRPSQARLSLVYASGAAENHTTFTAEDIQLAAAGIVDGTYQLVDLTHPSGYLWIRVTAGDRMDGRCTVEATRPEGEVLGFYITKLPPREAAAWLTGYPNGQFLPGGKDWKRMKKS